MISYKDKEIARQIIMDQYESPINKIDESKGKQLQDYQSFYSNTSSCEDSFTVCLKIENNSILDAKFYGSGCVVSSVATDMLCEAVKNQTVLDAKQILDNYYKMINTQEYDEQMLGPLNVFCNVGNQMNRVKCALVGLNAINNILEK